MSGYVQRAIDLTIQLGEGDFGEAGFNTVTLSGLRMSAAIVKAGGVSFGSAQLRIFGLTLSLMNQLSTLGKVIIETRRNVVSISAGDAVSGMSLVFVGTIQAAWSDFQGMPNAMFNIQAFVGTLAAMAPVPPTSFRGSADAATVMAGLATQMGLSFENSGVSVQLANPYFPGTARTQAESCARAANINWLIDNTTLAIWPKNGTRGGQVPLISPETGMVGYPTYTGTGIMVRTLFNPSVQHGAQIKVQSSLTPACGIWVVNRLTYNLECQTPGGAWFTDLEVSRPGVTVISR